MHFGEKIRAERLKKGLSQENVAEELGISTNAYGDIERNKTDVTVSRLLKISKILHANVDVFIKKPLEKSEECKEEIIRLKAEVLLHKIESARWKDRYMRTLFEEKAEKKERNQIGF